MNPSFMSVVFKNYAWTKNIANGFFNIALVSK